MKAKKVEHFKVSEDDWKFLYVVEAKNFMFILTWIC